MDLPGASLVDVLESSLRPILKRRSTAVLDLKKYQRTIMLRKKLVELHTCRRYARHATARQQSLDLSLQDKQIVLIISPTISYLSHIPVTKHIEAIEDDFIGEN